MEIGKLYRRYLILENDCIAKYLYYLIMPVSNPEIILQSTRLLLSARVWHFPFCELTLTFQALFALLTSQWGSPIDSWRLLSILKWAILRSFIISGLLKLRHCLKILTLFINNVSLNSVHTAGILNYLIMEYKFLYRYQGQILLHKFFKKNWLSVKDRINWPRDHMVLYFWPLLFK